MITKTIKLIYYSIINKKIDWDNLVVKKKFINSYQVSYSLDFPQQSWSFTLIRIDNTSKYDTTISNLSNVIVKTRLETYRDILTMILDLGTDKMRLNDGSFLNMKGFRRFIYRLFL